MASNQLILRNLERQLLESDKEMWLTILKFNGLTISLTDLFSTSQNFSFIFWLSFVRLKSSTTSRHVPAMREAERPTIAKEAERVWNDDEQKESERGL